MKIIMFVWFYSTQIIHGQLKLGQCYVKNHMGMMIAFLE